MKQTGTKCHSESKLQRLTLEESPRNNKNSNCHSEKYLQSLSHEESQKSGILRKMIQRRSSQNDTVLVGTHDCSHGITLIALVVTLVVLLILAGVTISTILSEGGILSKANQAKEKQEVAEMLDKLTIAEASTATNYLAVDLEKYKAELKTEGIVKQDESNYIVSADELSYELTSDKGYVFTVTEPTKGDIVITYEGKVGQLPPKIIDIKAIEKTASSIKTQVNVTRLENGILSYYYKKASDADYITFKENTTEKEANFTGLAQNQIYTIKVVAQNSFGKSNELIVNVIAGELQSGTISQKGITAWTNGQASIELQTTMPSFEMQYQLNSIDGKWLKYAGTITGLKHNDVVYARLWDGMNGSASSSIQIMDEILPKDATITFNATSVEIGIKVTATITQKDEESGIDNTKCKWVLNASNTAVGKDEANYTGTITNNPQTIDILTNKSGTYYLHVLSIDKAGNKKETIATAIKIKSNITADGSYSQKKGVNTPKLADEMTPIKWDETKKGWVEPISEDDWYDYNTKQWANAQTKDGSYWVWIPRYSYQIADNYHNGGSGVSGTINVEFMKGITNESSNGRTSFQNASGQGNWNIHPAFNYGSEVSGIWVAKFEASRIDSSIQNAGYTDTMKIQPTVSSWSSITVNDMYTHCLNYSTTLNSHLMKNVEWGAVAYLSKSKYGKDSVEVGINECSSYITGMGPGGNADVYNGAYAYNASYVYNTMQGQKASTTGNTYGVYDMSGGTLEYVAAYVNNGNVNLTKYGNNLYSGVAKNKDIYAYNTSQGDRYDYNYTANSNKYGDAWYETSIGERGRGDDAWFRDTSMFSYSNSPFMLRGGGCNDKWAAGLFTCNQIDGSMFWSLGFRPVIVAL